MTNPNDSAFPYEPQSEATGLTKREYFAALFMQSVFDINEPNINHYSTYAYRAVLLADELINALNDEE